MAAGRKYIGASKPKVAKPRAGRVGMYVDSVGDHRWQVVAPNGKIVADCAQGYASKAMAEKGLRAAAAAIVRYLDGGQAP